MFVVVQKIRKNVSNTFHTIVVGLGAMGSATLYQLAKAGHRVCGIDQGSPPHRFGSSHGETRITRLAIGEGEEYTPLAIRSHELWREIEAQTGQNLLHEVGGLVIANSVKQTSHGVTDFLQRTIDAANRYHISHEILPPVELKRRYPMFNFRGDEYGYYEPTAGYVCPEKCVQAQLDLAVRAGAEIRVWEELVSLEPVGNRVKVLTSLGEYLADNVVISAGAWVSYFLGGEYASRFTVTRQNLYWFDMEPSLEAYTPPNFPIFIWLPDRMADMIYGFPAIDGPTGGMKIATEDFSETFDPIEKRIDPTPGEVEKMISLVKQFLPSVGSYIRGTSCLYTCTPNFRFVIDKHPKLEKVWVVSPCSGHGFKHSAAIGEALAKTITTGVIDEKIQGFGW